MTDTVTREAHSSGSDYLGNSGKCVVKVGVSGVVFPRDVENHSQHSRVDSVYVAFHLCCKKPGFTTIAENAFYRGYKHTSF